MISYSSPQTDFFWEEPMGFPETVWKAWAFVMASTRALTTGKRGGALWLVDRLANGVMANLFGYNMIMNTDASASAKMCIYIYLSLSLTL